MLINRPISSFEPEKMTNLDVLIITNLYDKLTFLTTVKLSLSAIANCSEDTDRADVTRVCYRM